MSVDPGSLLGDEPVGGDWHLLVRHFAADRSARSSPICIGATQELRRSALVINMAMLIVTSNRAHRLAPA